ncbi:APH(3') family aminoglycoside O-phosphotransferase [Reinekea sp. G2M2-21]|uniref:APH(3') family aminoglycoside O-phosphotransferase n=1 Tax=Reinekea sp. G2M2-21 TaxID=2788942 RepID=UPI0018A8F499|nr:APH(3') family aminoglycoside O-phosphotransferase [Reinekea sp. G2M2-21]
MNTTQLPKELHRLNINHLVPVTSGRSNAAVYKCQAMDAPCYLKMQPVTYPVSFSTQAGLLAWLNSKLPVPNVIWVGQDTQTEYLLLSAIEGENGVDAMATTNKAELTRLLSEGLRAIHATGIEDCPVDQSVELKLRAAEQNMQLGLVDEADFDASRQGWPAEKVYEQMCRLLPFESDLVFGHGDYCLPNIILKNQSIAGFIDFDRGGISDRYNDLAIASRSIADNLGSECEALFFDVYGLRDPDWQKIKFFRMLDEFF